MSARKGITIRVGESAISTETGRGFDLTRQARARGMASLLRFHPGHHTALWNEFATRAYARVKLADIRKALDNLTIEESPEERVYLKDGGSPSYVNYRHFARWVDSNEKETGQYADDAKMINYLQMRLTPKGDVSVKMPCGEIRRYKVRTLDRVLTRLGA